ncbi:MAG TPA: DUF547 domain-containing protein [Candidatus Binatia bacterium]|nr:DUF547 domain-containing protein [Candidatus Binatia bacterium]
MRATSCSTSTAATRCCTTSSPGCRSARPQPHPERRALGAALLALVVAAPAVAAPKAKLWERWAAQGTESAPVDHAAWDAFVRKYVRSSPDGIHRVPYGRIGNADRQALEAYVRRLQTVAISRHPRAEQRAFWINLYNAATLKTVLAHYPVESILKIGISPGLFARGPWGAPLLQVEGETVTLDDIEHRILRPLWKDPRTHYAVNCASLGCPNLATRAYTAANTETLLEAGARAYVNHPRGAQVVDGRLVVSSLYEWFEDDFGGDDAGVIAHLKQYAAPKLAAQLQRITRIDDDRYDWALNDLK